ncbi:MAG TPA: DUF1961 domain-containing protein [Flavobacteriales bacterium]|nr:DUF1961 domain-containing protein [Flavobacteriales bacterium]
MNLRPFVSILIPIMLVVIGLSAKAQTPEGELIYTNSLSSEEGLKDWVMEGAGETQFSEGWMSMFSAEEKGHHVYWCPKELPASFIAEWEVRNLHTEAGLCIVFFAAKGNEGEDVLSKDLKPRDGIFKQYTKGDINNYHISYYANTPTQKDRPHAHLRKNKGFYKVQTGESGIAYDSKETHRVKLIKVDNHIQMFVDGRSIVDWTDDGAEYGPVLGAGKLAFRQMKWTRFQYRDLKVWELKK